MLRQLFLMLRHWTYSLRQTLGTLRGWMWEWLYVLSTPIREFRPRAWLGLLVHGVREVLAMGRQVRPREFGSEMVAGSFDAVGVARGTVGTVAATVAGVFWLIVWLPWGFARLCYRGPIWLFYFLTSCSWQVLAYFALFTIVLVGGGTAVCGYLLQEHWRTTRLGMNTKQYDFCVLGSDVDKLEAALVALVADDPDNAALARRLDMVRDRNAPVSEPKLVRFFMRHHMVNGRVNESVREAEKLLESLPEDWEARCYLADAAMKAGDKAAAEKHLAVLPPAAEVAETIPANVAVYSAFLFDRVGDKARFDEMVEFITMNILPALRMKEMVHFPIGDKLFLIRCYFIALSQLEKRTWLTKYWLPVQQAYQSIMDDPAADVPTLVLIGQVAQKDSLKCLQEFLRRKLVSNDEFNAMAKDVLERQKALWHEVLRREPRNQWGFIGLAEYHAALGEMAAAEAVAVRGLKECGAAPDLVAATAELLRRTDPQRGLTFLETVLRDEDLTPRMCFVFEQVATQANYRDKALAACRRALKQDQKLYWARLRAAEICMDLGRPTEAAAVFEPMKAELAKDPKGTGLYVRALCECGSYHQAEEFLESAAASQCPPAVLLQAAKGLQTARRPAEAVRWGKRVLDREPNNVDALLLVGDNQRLLADTENQGWDRNLAREALRSYRAVLRHQPDNLGVVNNIVWLELKALNLPRDAYESAAKLRAVQNQVRIPAEYLETLGAVYIAVEQHDQAVKVLRDAVSTAGGRFSFYLHLALAYHGLKQNTMTDHFFNKAAEIPNKSPKEVSELYEAGKVINRR
jgi:tetratricopeptide (TPR) repeat protein